MEKLDAGTATVYQHIPFEEDDGILTKQDQEPRATALTIHERPEPTGGLVSSGRLTTCTGPRCLVQESDSAAEDDDDEPDWDDADWDDDNDEADDDTVGEGYEDDADDLDDWDDSEGDEEDEDDAPDYERYFNNDDDSDVEDFDEDDDSEDE